MILVDNIGTHVSRGWLQEPRLCHNFTPSELRFLMSLSITTLAIRQRLAVPYGIILS